MIASTSELPMAWDDEADLIVCGSGCAGLTGAVVAAAEGATVILLEKTAFLGGTTALSGGGVWIPVNHHMADLAVDDSNDDAITFLRACAGDQGDDEILVAFVEQGQEMVDYLEERGIVAFRPWPAAGSTFDYRSWLPGASRGPRSLDPGKFATARLGEWVHKIRVSIQSRWVIDKLEAYASSSHARPVAEAGYTRHSEPDGLIEHFANGTSLIGQLVEGCLKHGVTLLTDTPAAELVVDGGRVIGVRGYRDGNPYAVRADRGVLMATGGFGGSEELKRMWLNRPLQLTCEIEENTGDGHLMGMAVGAQVANLGDAWWTPMIEVGGRMRAASTREDRALPHSIIVNRRGRRFMNESLNYNDACEPFGLKVGGSARNLPAWIIFDEQARTAYAVFAARVPATGEPPPWLTIGGSLDELAKKLDVDGPELAQTVARFNEFARNGVDEDFDRGASAWDRSWGDPNHSPNPSLGMLERPPFYAMEIKPGALATKGGLRVSANAQVVSAARPFEPIPGLYAAGNCSSALVPGSYGGAGTTLGFGMTFGYVAARHIAADVGALGSRASATRDR